MMKRRMILKTLIVCLLVLTALIGMTACQNTSYELSLDKTEITLNAGTFYQLTATVNAENPTIEWSSSNENVATVTADGKVYGVNEGLATVTAKYLTITAVCQVKVEPSLIPVFITATVNGINDLEYDLYYQDTAALSLKLYDGTEQIQTDFTVKSSDENVVGYENGLLTANGLGNATISFTTEYKGETYESSIKINVIKTLYISINKNQIDLSAATVGGEYSHDFDLNPTVYKENNQIVEDANITYSVDNENIVSIENGVITALKKGIVKVTLTYVDADGYEVSTFANVTVHLTNKTFEETILLSKYDFADKYVIGSKYIEGEVVYCQTIYSDGTTKNSDKAEFPISEYKTGSYLVTVETTSSIYTGEMVLADMVINTKEQLKNWPYYIRPNDWANNKALEYDGYVVLGDNIDYGGDVYFNELGSWSYLEEGQRKFYIGSSVNQITYNKSGEGLVAMAEGYEPVFVGTFDGLGHCISGLTISYQAVGLFGSYCEGTIKNLAITSGKVNYYRTGLVCGAFNGVAENMFVEGRISNNKTYTGLFAGQNASSGNTPEYRKVVSVLTEGNNRTDCGIITGATRKLDIAENSFAIGHTGLFMSGGNALNTKSSPNYATLKGYKDARVNVETFTKDSYWDTSVSGFPIMKSAIGKLTKINLQAIDGSDAVVTDVSAGQSVNVKIANFNVGEYTNNQSGFAVITVSQIDGVTLTNGVLTVASTVSKDTEITLTALNNLDGSITTLKLKVK